MRTTRRTTLLMLVVLAGCASVDAQPQTPEPSGDHIAWQSIYDEWHDWLVAQNASDPHDEAVRLAEWFRGGPCVDHMRRMVDGTRRTC